MIIRTFNDFKTAFNEFRRVHPTEIGLDSIFESLLFSGVEDRILAPADLLALYDALVQLNRNTPGLVDPETPFYDTFQWLGQWHFIARHSHVDTTRMFHLAILISQYVHQHELSDAILGRADWLQRLDVRMIETFIQIFETCDLATNKDNGPLEAFFAELPRIPAPFQLMLIERIARVYRDHTAAKHSDRAQYIDFILERVPGLLQKLSQPADPRAIDFPKDHMIFDLYQIWTVLHLVQGKVRDSASKIQPILTGMQTCMDQLSAHIRGYEGNMAVPPVGLPSPDAAPSAITTWVQNHMSLDLLWRQVNIRFPEMPVSGGHMSSSMRLYYKFPVLVAQVALIDCLMNRAPSTGLFSRDGKITIAEMNGVLGHLNQLDAALDQDGKDNFVAFRQAVIALNGYLDQATHMNAASAEIRDIFAYVRENVCGACFAVIEQQRTMAAASK